MITTLAEAEVLIQINRNDLSTDLERQPTVYSEISDATALAVEREDTAKAVMENMEASLSLEIRRNAAPSDKLSEAKIEAMVKVDQRYAEAQVKYFSFKKEASMWKGKMKSADQRNSCVNTLSYQQNREYFSGSGGTHLTSGYNKHYIKEAEERQEQARRSTQEGNNE